MGEACGIDGRKKECVAGKPAGNGPLGKSGGCERIILKWVLKM
jgi:hypothetical protein